MKLIDRIAEIEKTSKNKAKQFLDSRNVFVNGKRIWIASFDVNPHDRIEITKSIKNTKKIFPIHEDENLLIINKSPGIASTGANSLETMLKTAYNNQISAIHRLDKDTSGVILFSKNRLIHEDMLTLFKAKKIKKTYLALINGHCPFKSKEISIKIDEKEAFSHFELIQETPEASLLKVTIQTGRTHQIRIHLKSIGLYLLGEKEYFKGEIRKPLFREVSRQMLHSWKIGFRNPITCKEMDFTAPLFEDMTGVMSKLRIHIPV